jgi:hypothetical protein
MSSSLGERLLIPLLIAGIFALLSFGFMFLVGGGTQRMRTVGLCSLLFITGVLYCMAWHEQLTDLTGWDNAWIGMAGIVAAGTIGLCRVLLLRQERQRAARDE